MASVNQPGIKIQVLVVEDIGKDGVFRDALYFTPDEFEALREEDLTTAKQARVDAHLVFLADLEQNPPPEPTVEQLDIEKADLEARIAEIEAIKEAKNPKEEPAEPIDTIEVPVTP